MKNAKYKIAFFDVENAPNLAFVWDKYEQNVIAFEREWTMLSFAFKWAGDKTVKVYSLADFPRYKKDRFDDSQLIAKLWDLFNEADLLVAHNGDAFDCRKANARFVLNGLQPPSPYRTVDTLKVARKHFKFNSNKLTDLCEVFGIGSKVETGGFNLWLSCLRGDEAAWRKMKKYNAHDVVLLEKVYEKLRPWMAAHPNITLGTGESLLCPACGSDTELRGWRTLKSYRARSYRCKNRACGKWSQGSREKIKAEVLA